MDTLEKVIEAIEDQYSPEDILDLLDEEIYNWDYGYYESEIEEYEFRWDFYSDYNNKEAEDAVIDAIFASLGTTTNTVYLALGANNYDEFREWLNDYTGHSF